MQPELHLGETKMASSPPAHPTTSTTQQRGTREGGPLLVSISILWRLRRLSRPTAYSDRNESRATRAFVIFCSVRFFRQHGLVLRPALNSSSVPRHHSEAWNGDDELSKSKAGTDGRSVTARFWRCEAGNRLRHHRPREWCLGTNEAQVLSIALSDNVSATRFPSQEVSKKKTVLLTLCGCTFPTPNSLAAE